MIWTVTIPTIGFITYEVEAGTEEEARQIILDEAEKVTVIEESAGDWAEGSEWQFEASEVNE